MHEAGGRPVRLSETELARQRTDIGMVFQRFNLFPHLTALGNVMIGLTEVRRRSRAEARAVAETMLSASGWRIDGTSSRRSCRAASSSGSRSPGPS